ncbi:MAG: filamentous hemagglutinin N-terminal domain-containing protein, partial [Gammaproteobacteria bacterium]|nr:filamentous hemagglutinin N-terminal domain-containing protein [Gammaproteobacteria bacterium]
MKTENSILFADRADGHLQNALRYRHYLSSDGHPIKPKLLYTAIASLMPAVALAAPQSGDVVAGVSAISSPDANTTLIQQTTDHSIINWQSFSIAGDEYVQYIQPNTASISLNRVIGGNPSSILGSLSANGQVYLVNPNGIYFGAGVQVDVSGLVASVLDINDQDFMAGNYSFSKSPDAPLGNVINDGLINARNQGYVVLMGDYTQNNGVIQAQMGEVVLASGSKITMDVSGNNLISVAVDEATVNELAGVENTGEIYADGGRVIMTAKVANDLISTAVNNDGLVRANSIVEHDGAIFLTGIGGDINNSGTLDASAESGSGVDGGGVLVYSDRDISLSSRAVIAAQGDGDGSGGVARVIAEEYLDHQSGAMIDVTSETGKGGFVEVSGHSGLKLAGDITPGSGGQLLIDPATMSIVAGTTAVANAIGVSSIATQLNAGVDVTLIASSSFTAPSPVTINASTGGGNLSIKSGTVAFNTLSGTLSSGALNCSNGECVTGGFYTFSANATGDISLSNLTITVNGGLTVAGGTATGNVSMGTISAGGNVSIDAGGNITLNGGITGGGNVAITGTQLFLNSSMVLDAGNDLSLNADLGAVATPHAFDVTLSANNNVNINNDIFLASNNLTLAADGDSNSVGNVEINGSTTESRTVSTQGLLSVTGENFNINGADFGTTPAVSIGTATALDVQANGI